MNCWKCVAVTVAVSLAGLNGENASAQNAWYPTVQHIRGAYPSAQPYLGGAVPNCPNGQCRFRGSYAPVNGYAPARRPAGQIIRPAVVQPTGRRTLPVLSEPRKPVYGYPSSRPVAPHSGFFSVDDEIGPPAGSATQRRQPQMDSPFYNRPGSAVPGGRSIPRRPVPTRPVRPRPTSDSPFYR